MNKARREKDLIQVLFCLYKMEKLDMLNTECQGEGRRMKTLSAFDIIGPRMMGPSSSHTAGAARLAKIAGRIGGPEVRSVVFTLYGSFAQTYKGHGTDKALVAGILGMEPDDERLPDSFAIAQQAGLEIRWILSEETKPHPNTVRIETSNRGGKSSSVVGESIGGGNLVITNINGVEVEITGEYPTMIVDHTDEPGVVGSVTRVLGECSINIAFMRVFRKERGGKAYMVIETDDRVNTAVLSNVKDAHKAIEQVTMV